MMTRQQRRATERQQAKDPVSGTRFAQQPDADDPNFVELRIRIPNGGMPTAVYEGKDAVSRLARFASGWLYGFTTEEAMRAPAGAGITPAAVARLLRNVSDESDQRIGDALSGRFLRDLDDVLPDAVPDGGFEAAKDSGFVPPNARGFTPADGMRMLTSVGQEKDGKRWLHLSVSRGDRLPDYDDIARVKETWIGPDRMALQLFPRRDEHVNLHPRTLHLWCSLDGDVTPDFRILGLV